VHRHPRRGTQTLQAEFAAGNRVIAVATREMPGASSTSTADEHDLAFRGILVFLDPPKPTAKAALARLARRPALPSFSCLQRRYRRA